MNIRPARPDEYEELTRIWKSAVEATHDFVTPEEIAGWEPRIATEFLPSCEVLVAAGVDDEPLGFIGADGDSLEMLFVDPDIHRKGVGRALVEHLKSDRPGLEVEVNEENPGAIDFYERLGFRTFGRSDVDSDGGQHPLVRMRLSS